MLRPLGKHLILFGTSDIHNRWIFLAGELANIVMIQTQTQIFYKAAIFTILLNFRLYRVV